MNHLTQRLLYLSFLVSLSVLHLNVSSVCAQESARLTLDLSKPGRAFMGMGGNFRLQNPQQDSKVIDYCLTHLRVAYGRVEMPWKDWHPQENMNPLNQQQLSRHVAESMVMAALLCQKGIPVILSCWFPPEWATTGEIDEERAKWGVKAWRLNPEKKQQIFRSLADYMEYAQKHYGVTFSEFSFNESDLGIDVFFTPEQHATFIGEFGAYLAKRHLRTKLLLGDNSNALSLDFIRPALQSKALFPYLGAVAFHSWDGCNRETLSKWQEAAQRTQKPLLVTEGSTDAQAWRHPESFKDPAFAMKEINRYVDICNFCQPLCILQWQYTSDYSLMAGEGLCSDNGQLRPTQRFWNIKQLGSTPPQVHYIPTQCSSSSLNCVAFAGKGGKQLAIHAVNNGNETRLSIQGIPRKAKHLKAYVTHADSNMQPLPFLQQGTTLTVVLPPNSFISLFGE